MKNAIVTGANKGIGLGITREFAQNGISVWACARTPSPQFEAELAAMEAATGSRIRPLYFDVTDRMAAKAAILQACKEDGRLDVLVNNAGINAEMLYLMTPIEKMEQIFAVNYFAPMYLSQIAARLMARSKSGSIIHIASVSGVQNEVGGTAYGSSKAALIFATRSMAQELGPYGIRVNAVSPGFIDTDMWAKRSCDTYERVLQKTPLMRQGTVQDVAKAVYYLASDDAAYVTGCNIIVDGGGLSGSGPIKIQ